MSYEHEPTSTTTLDVTDQSNVDIESSVTSIYQAFIEDSPRNIIITWSKSSTSHSLTITIESRYDEDHQTCQIDFQSWQFWSRKGLKTLQVDDGRVDIFWDFRDVKFSINPDPCSCYYVAFVFDKEMVLLIGDLKAEALKRTMSKPSQVSPILLHKEEILYGKNNFQTQVLLDDGQKEHNVVIENPSLRHGEQELRVSIDGRVVVRVMNLNWRFRGNETALVNNVPVQIFWDVHDWLFNCPGSAHGLFIFKPGSLENVLDDGDHEGDEEDDDEEKPVVVGCCHFVFAVKVN
ncbi:hypothetical protein RND81_04G174900 [Saponaria officinalis]|uniref:DUF868 family protein n=1 Tax=Saponaria officinalis TaxID=3572 RepID=A0AAW1LFH5_SAPOF